MRIAILHNRDHDVLADDPGREAREDVERVASAVHGALTQAGHTVDLVPVEHDLSAVTDSVTRRRPDVVVNLCESLHGDSRGEMIVPAVLDLLRVQFTGNASLTLALALHKDKAKELLRARGVPTPEFWLVDSADALKGLDLPFPLIVKPSREDASVGIDFDSVVTDRKALARPSTACSARSTSRRWSSSSSRGARSTCRCWARPRRGLAADRDPLRRRLRGQAARAVVPGQVAGRLRPSAWTARRSSPSLPRALEARCVEVAQGRLRGAGRPRLRPRGPAGRRRRAAFRHRHQPQLRSPPAGGVREGRPGGWPLVPAARASPGGSGVGKTQWRSGLSDRPTDRSSPSCSAASRRSRRTKCRARSS